MEDARLRAERTDGGGLGGEHRADRGSERGSVGERDFLQGLEAQR